MPGRICWSRLELGVMRAGSTEKSPGIPAANPFNLWGKRKPECPSSAMVAQPICNR